MTRIVMLIKELVEIAAKVYELTKGSRKVLAELQKLDESQLPNAILDLKEKKSDIGTSVTKNMIDVLIHVVKVRDNRETADFALKAIDKLSVDGIKILPSQKGWLSSLFASEAPLDPVALEYNNFIKSSRQYISDLSANSREALDLIIKDEHFIPEAHPEIEKKSDPIEELKSKIQLLETELQQIKLQLVEKEIELKSTKNELEPYKDKYTKLVASEQNPEQIRQVLYCIIMELEFEKAFKSASRYIYCLWGRKKRGY